MKKIYIQEKSLTELKNKVMGDKGKISHNLIVHEDTPPYEADEFEIGGEGGNNDYFHININESAYADLDGVDQIEYYIDETYWYDEDEHNDWENYAETEEDYLKSCWRIEGETYDTDGHHIDYFEGNRDEIVDMFGDEIAEMMFNKEGKKGQNGSYWITDIIHNSINHTDKYDLSNPSDVMKAAKQISSNNGPSEYILTDGSLISFHDHQQISSIGDMTINRFLQFGHIRIGNGYGLRIELIKEPTFEQYSVLKRYVKNSNEVFLDIAEPNDKEDGMYPHVIHSVSYRNPHPERVTNDIVYYFQNGVKPVNENIEMEVDANDVSLDSFRKNEMLAPNIWDGDTLNSRVRLKLLDIADDFWDFTNINWVKIDAIHLTGSICNFNWSKFSDIDLHIVVDFSKIDERTDFVQDYFNAKKNEWNDEHTSLKIYGFPVELYVEDVNAETSSDGVYDLEANKWIKHPNKDNIDSIKLDKYEIKNKSAKLMTMIDDLNDEFNATNDDAELRNIGKRAKKLLNKIKRMRKFGLNRGGESDILNIIYKVLRRNEYLDKLWDLSSMLYDKINSIGLNENFSENTNVFEIAKERFGTTPYLKFAGYILPDGSLLNFSYCGIQRDIDHREISDLNYEEDLETETGLNVSMYSFINDGAIRIDASSGLINLSVPPTEIQKNVLGRLIRMNDGDIMFEIGDGIDYVEYNGANYRKILADIDRYFNEGIKPSSLNENKILDEYLEKDNNYPLYRYFKWAKEATDKEKAVNLASKCPWYLQSYIEEKYYDNEEILQFDEYDYEDIERVIEILDENSDCEDFIDWVQTNGYYPDFPSWMTMDFIRVVKNEWCIHFTKDAYGIANNGFTGGTEDIDSLAYTDAGGFKSSAGFDFAFLLDDDRYVDFNQYGDEAVIFRTSGVLVFHYGDEQNQVIFYGPNVKEFIPIKKENMEWVIQGMHYQTLATFDRPSEIAEWAVDNLPQYRKQIMTGKNGYIPKRFNPVTNKTEPYEIYKNESIIKYIKILQESVNEEVVADSNADHNPFAKRWAQERKVLKDYLINYGETMTSKENGKEYKVIYDSMLSQRLGINYCICIQWDSLTMTPGNIIYVRAFDKFTRRRFKAQFDTRGRDNISGTADDVV